MDRWLKNGISNFKKGASYMRVIVGREQEVTLNGELEYILHGKDNPLGAPLNSLVFFRSKESAVEIMEECDMTSEDIKACKFIKVTHAFCPKCKARVELTGDEQNKMHCTCGYENDNTWYDVDYDPNGESL